MEKYINEIPLVVRNSLKALSDEKRQSILIYLLKTGSKSFTDIRKDLNFSKSNLSHHVKTLMQYGLIYNFYNKDEFADKYSFYKISKLGKVMINNLFNLVIPLKEDFLIDTTMDKAIVEELPTDTDLIGAVWMVPTEPEIGGYSVVRRDVIDAGTGLEIPDKKSLEEESKLNLIS